MKGEDMVAPQAKLICGRWSSMFNNRWAASDHHAGHPDGSLTGLVPVDEATFKRLHLLQGQLTRNVQHTAGLNPRAFR
jgi:cleavage and polyadenylation specificity factor subunit 1